MSCPVIEFTFAGAGTIILDGLTPNPITGVVWTDGDLTGWYEPPKPARSVIDGVNGGAGQRLAQKVTNSRWAPRELNLTMVAVCEGQAAAVSLALHTVTQFGSPELQPGILLVEDPIPKAIVVRMNGRPSTEIQGKMAFVQVTVPLIAHNPLRAVVGSGALVV